MKNLEKIPSRFLYVTLFVISFSIIADILELINSGFYVPIAPVSATFVIAYLVIDIMIILQMIFHNEKKELFLIPVLGLIAYLFPILMSLVGPNISNKFILVLLFWPLLILTFILTIKHIEFN